MVATCGRLKQFVKDGLVDLSKVRFFILDEADRMLDMGFMPDVREIVEKLTPKVILNVLISIVSFLYCNCIVDEN